MIARTVLGKILVFSVFFIGIVTGVILDTAYRTRVSSAGNAAIQKPQNEPHLTLQERMKRDQERMAEYLGLDKTQQEQIAKIMEESRGEFRSLREKTDPEFKALREKTDPQFKAIEDASRAKIRAVLNPEQQKKIDEFWARRASSRGRQGPRPGERPEKSDRHDRQ